jgi:predicted AlkP superfamily pyrophosphatase or phosphodiesterase
MFALLTLLPLASPVAPQDDSPPVALVLQITVDQLRGDAVTRFADRFVEGGFNLLLSGTHYTNAHYPHANTETAPGHASLATGANPSRHGIVANDWIDQTTGEFVYNTEDERHHILGAEPRAHQGVSPRNLLSSTIGDEIVIHNGERSRAFSVSAKDRGAILPGGHRGKAFWYSKRDGRFVTSTYYYDEYPDWMEAWNAKRLADELKGKSWELTGERADYLARVDDRPYELAFDALGRTFPHPLGDGSSKLFYVVLYVSPMADTLSLDFVKTLIEAEEVGQKGHTDYLQVSFSAPDICGHLYGQASLEYEDAVLRTDRLLADLFAHVDSTVGLDRTLIVLSADHGGTEAPEYLAATGREVGRFPLDIFRRQNPLAGALQERFGRDDLIGGHSHPYLYLNLAAIAEAGLDQGEVERFVAAEAIKLPGIHYALTRSDLLEGRYADAPLQRQIRNSFHPARSGHVHLVQEQGWLLHSTQEAEKLGLKGDLAAIHGSPWTYDTYVPILVAGPGVPYQKVHRRVSPYDIAPTIAAYLGVKPPTGSVGEPLVEVLSK